MDFSLTGNLRRSAERSGASVAIQHGDRITTYSALWERAREIGSWLLARGLRPGERVAIILPNSVEYVAALYGVWLAQGIAVPLYPGAKCRDYSAWMSHCEPRVVFSAAGNAEVLAAVRDCGLDAEIVDVARMFDGWGGHSSEEGIIRGSVTGADPAMVIYTSGTTGRPKGVTLSHASLVANTDAVIESLGLREGESIVNVLPFAFSYGNSVLNTHLKVAGRLVLENSLVFPHKVVEVMQNERVSGFAGVPSTFSLLLSRVDLRKYDLSALRYITQAGGPMPASVTRKLRDALPASRLYIMYGQTEATARLTCLPPDQVDARPASVGLPIAGVEIEVRDPSPGDGVGEVWARGPGIMLGYWRDEERTRTTIQGGWLRTGDMGWLDQDGFLHLVGRRSDIIKVGAYRVHPMDVEEVISEMREVREVVAVGVADDILGQVVKVYVVPNGNMQLGTTEIQAYCRVRLATYKVPRYVEMVDALPRTSSGKVKRFALQEQVN